MITNPVLLAIL